MCRKGFFLVVVVCAVAVVCSATNFVVPTTTLSAQLVNNTSAAKSFPNQSNGNLGAANISKVNVHSLLYAGATTKVYAHLLLWFGQSNHMNVGYSSNDPAQVHRQITDMISRGINGVIIDWYGPNNFIDQATKLVMTEAEKHPGFTFAIMVDQGAIEWDSCAGCSAQQALINQLQYLERTYFTSPAYMKIGGRPVVTNFNIDFSYSVDWNAVNAALSNHPVFLFQNNNGFTHTLSGGSYSWVMPTTSDYGMSYLTSFYNAGMLRPSEQTVGITYKGFNDTLASWGSNRIMGQQCGQTWLQTFSKINSLFNSGKQLDDLQLVTWNDYEEGTEIESGIDDCVAISASISGGGLEWKISGNESTISHYNIYLSNDGQNLMKLAQEARGNRSLNLCSFPIPAGNYKVIVQAAGQPSMANRITGAISYSPACSKISGVSLNASPSSQTIAAGQSRSFTVTAAVQSGASEGQIWLTCGNLPSDLSCSFSPNSVTPVAGGATSTLAISVVPQAGADLRYRHAKFAFAVWTLPLGLVGFTCMSSGRRRRIIARCLAIFCTFGISLVLASCGGGGPGSSASAVSSASSYSVTVIGNSPSGQISTAITVVVQ
jgi:hypothetical protein